MIVRGSLVQIPSSETPWAPVQELRVGDILSDPLFGGKTRVACIRKLARKAPAATRNRALCETPVQFRAGEYRDDRPWSDVILSPQQEIFIKLRRGGQLPVIDTVRADSFVSTGVAEYCRGGAFDFFDILTDHGGAICVNGLAITTRKYMRDLHSVFADSLNTQLPSR